MHDRSSSEDTSTLPSSSWLGSLRRQLSLSEDRYGQELSFSRLDWVLSGQFVPFKIRRRLKRVPSRIVLLVVVATIVLYVVFGGSAESEYKRATEQEQFPSPPVRHDSIPGSQTVVKSPLTDKPDLPGTAGSASTNDAAGTGVTGVTALELEEIQKRLEEEEAARALASRLQRKKFDEFEERIQTMRQLASSTFPLKLLRYCSNPRYKPSNANYLVSIDSADGTMTRLDFGPANTVRYNPNLLPFPKGYKYPYLGFARQSPENLVIHHEVIYCEMEWVESQDINGHRSLRCAGPGHTAEVLDLGGRPSQPGTCLAVPFLEIEQGHTDPRIFFSPIGEPLMVVGSNGISNCLNQYIIDLRAVIPDLSQKMGLTDIPVKYSKLVEMPRQQYNEVEKNWFLLWDENNVGYVQHEVEQRSISLLDAPQSEVKNIIPPPGTPPAACVSSLKRIIDPTVSHIYLHQATNSLRVTLCDFPCIPTVHNTVLIEIIHLKYNAAPRVFYKRYAIIMNATAPFDIIGRTGNIMYAGSDEDMMVYTVSISWDHPNHHGHEEWNEEEHGTIKIPEGYEEQEDKPISITEILQRLREEDDDDDVGIDNPPPKLSKRDFFEPSESERPRKLQKRAPPLADAMNTRSDRVPGTGKPLSRRKRIQKNPLVNQYYHGWLDDTLLINVGIDDDKTVVMHAHARDLLECLHLCEK